MFESLHDLVSVTVFLMGRGHHRLDAYVDRTVCWVTHEPTRHKPWMYDHNPQFQNRNMIPTRITTASANCRTR
jgi:hypothetical protein